MRVSYFGEEWQRLLATSATRGAPHDIPVTCTHVAEPRVTPGIVHSHFPEDALKTVARTGQLIGCGTCRISCENVLEQRRHFKSDLHW